MKRPLERADNSSSPTPLWRNRVIQFIVAARCRQGSLHHGPHRRPVNPAPMNAETVVKLIEDLVDLKLQQHAQANIKPNAEIARLLEEKRAADRRRLEQVRAELVRVLNG